LAVAFTMLLGAVQLVARLHQTSVVTAVATDAAHRVAEASPTAVADARRAADTRIRAVVGPDARIRWAAGADGPSVEIRVTAPRLPGLPGDIRRGAVARAERPA
jgi:hypothetical protein